MSAVILCGILNWNSPQENAGAFIGEYNFGGWDANVKACAAQATILGFFNYMPRRLNINLNGLSVIDGAINDQDFKPVLGVNV